MKKNIRSTISTLLTLILLIETIYGATPQGEVHLSRQYLAPSSRILPRKSSSPMESTRELHTNSNKSYSDLAPEEQKFYPFDEIISAINRQIQDEEMVFDPKVNTEMEELFSQTKDILNRVLKSAGLNPDNFNLHILDNDSFNAFIIPYSRDVYINRGVFTWLAKLNRQKVSKRVVAAILAHEVMHLIQYREKAARGEAWQDYDLLTSAQHFFQLDNFLQNLYNSYGKEYHADSGIPEILEKAGFSAHGAIELFEVLEAFEQASLFRRRISFCGVHPKNKKRKEEVKEIIRTRTWNNYHKEDEIFTFSNKNTLNSVEIKHLLLAKFHRFPNLINLKSLLKKHNSLPEINLILTHFLPKVLNSRFKLPGFKKRLLTFSDQLVQEIDKHKASHPNDVKVLKACLEKMIQGDKKTEAESISPEAFKNLFKSHFLPRVNYKEAQFFLINHFFKKYAFILSILHRSTAFYLASLFFYNTAMVILEWISPGVSSNIPPFLSFLFETVAFYALLFLIVGGVILFFLLPGGLRSSTMGKSLPPDLSVKEIYLQSLLDFKKKIRWEKDSPSKLIEMNTQIHRFINEHSLTQTDMFNLFDKVNPTSFNKSLSQLGDFNKKILFSVLGQYLKIPAKTLSPESRGEETLQYLSHLNEKKGLSPFLDGVLGKDQASLMKVYHLLINEFKNGNLSPLEIQILQWMLFKNPFNLRPSILDLVSKCSSFRASLGIEDFYGEKEAEIKKIASDPFFGSGSPEEAIQSWRDSDQRVESFQLLNDLLKEEDNIFDMLKTLKALIPHLELDDFLKQEKFENSWLGRLQDIYFQKNESKKLSKIDQMALHLKFYEDFFQAYGELFSPSTHKISSDSVTFELSKTLSSFISSNVFTPEEKQKFLSSKVTPILMELGIVQNPEQVSLECLKHIYTFFHGKALDYEDFKKNILEKLKDNKLSLADIQLLNMVFNKLVDKKEKVFKLLTAEKLNDLEYDGEEENNKNLIEKTLSTSRSEAIDTLLQVQTWEEYSLFLGQLSFFSHFPEKSTQETYSHLSKGFLDNEDNVSQTFFGEKGLGKGANINDQIEKTNVSEEIYRSMVGLFIKEEEKNFSRHQIMNISPDDLTQYFDFIKNSPLPYQDMETLILNSIPKTVYRNYLLYFNLIFKGLEIDQVQHFDFSKPFDLDSFIKKLPNDSKVENLKSRCHSILPHLIEDRRLEVLNKSSLLQILKLQEYERKGELKTPSRVFGITLSTSLFLIGILTLGPTFFISGTWLVALAMVLPIFYFFSVIDHKDKVLWLIFGAAIIGSIILASSFFSMAVILPSLMSIATKLSLLGKILFHIFSTELMLSLLGVPIYFLSSIFNKIFNKIDWPIESQMKMLSFQLNMERFLFASNSGKSLATLIGDHASSIASFLLMVPVHILQSLDFVYHLYSFNKAEKKLKKLKEDYQAGKIIDKASLLRWMTGQSFFSMDFLDLYFQHENKKNEEKEASPYKTTEDFKKKKKAAERRAAKRKEQEQIFKVIQYKSIPRLLAYGEQRLAVVRAHSYKNFWLTRLLSSLQRNEKVDKKNKKEATKREDFRFFRFGGKKSFVDDIIRDTFPYDIKDLSNSSLSSSLKTILSIYPGKSPRRDEPLLKIMEYIKSEFINNSTLNRQALTLYHQTALQISPLFYNQAFHYDAQYLAMNLEITLHPKLTENFDDELNQIVIKYFPQSSLYRDDILSDFMNKTQNPEEAEKIHKLFLKNTQEILQEGNAKKVFFGDKALELFQIMDKEKKLQFTLWLLGVQKKAPIFLQEYENFLQVDFSYLKEYLTKEPFGHYSSFGKSIQELLFEALFYGEEGIMTQKDTRNKFLNSLFDNFLPKGFKNRKKFKTIFLVTLNELDEEHQSEIIFNCLDRLKFFLQKPKSQLGKDAPYEAIRAFLEATAIGTKIGQILAYSNLVSDPKLPNVLKTLSSHGKPISNYVAFQQYKSIFGAFPFKALLKRLVFGSFGAVFLVKNKDKELEVTKLKKPEVDQLVDYEIKTFGRLLRKFKNKGLSIPKHLKAQVTEVMTKETKFSDEAQNSFEFEARIKSRWENNKEFDFSVLKPKDLRGNVYLSWEYKDDLITLDRLRNYDEIYQSKSSQLRLKGFSEEKIQEEVKKEAEIIAHHFSISIEKYDLEVEKLKAQFHSAIFKEFMDQIFIDGKYHGDPHGGNIFVKRDASGKCYVTLIDWGLTGDIQRVSQKWQILWWLVKSEFLTHPFFSRFIAKIPFIGSFFSAPSLGKQFIASSFFSKLGYLLDSLPQDYVMNTIVDSSQIDKEEIWNRKWVQSLSKRNQFLLSTIIMRLITYFSKKPFSKNKVKDSNLTIDDPQFLNFISQYQKQFKIKSSNNVSLSIILSALASPENSNQVMLSISNAYSMDSTKDGETFFKVIELVRTHFPNIDSHKQLLMSFWLTNSARSMESLSSWAFYNDHTLGENKTLYGEAA